MANELNLDAPAAVAAGQDLSASGAALVALSNGSVARVRDASGQQPWGGDEIGAAFQKNYGPLLDIFVEAFGNVSRYVEGLGDAAQESVNRNVAADDRASTAVAQAYEA